MEDKDQPAPAVDTNQIIEERKAKLKTLRSAGNAFPNDFRRSHLAADLHRDHDAKPNEDLEPAAIRVTVAGRMMLKRVMGKASFATLQDMSGRIQLYVSNDVTG
jgi:lysyl-tRNA synthetase class 2